MRLYRAARAFDLMPCVDAYTGKPAFMGQLGLYDDSKRDSEAAERRIISTAPDVTLPARRVVEAAGTRFILGRSNPDSYRGEVIRLGWVAHEATERVYIRSLQQACRGIGGTLAWAGFAWGKNLADNEQSSDLFPQFRIYLSQSEKLSQGQVIVAPSGVYVVRQQHLGPSGMLIGLIDRMPELCITTATLRIRTLDKVTEAASDVVVNTQVFRARWQSLYEYQSTMAPKFGPMDLQIAIDKAAATVAVGTRVEMIDGTWVLDSVASEEGVWLCRAVRHG